MYNVVRLSPLATKGKHEIWGPYISIPAIHTRGTWRVLDMLPTGIAVAMVKFRMTLKER